MEIPVYRLPYSNNDILYVKKHIEILLKRGYLTDGGEYVKQFETDFAEFCGARHAVSVNSCTTALELILKCINVHNKSVIVPTYTFYATPLSVLNSGGKVIYADISRKTLSLSLESIKEKCREDTKAVIIVHAGGIVSDEIDKIKDYLSNNNIYLIEDAACAHGATFNNIIAGNFGDAAAFSFHHSKVLTTGEGGMVVSENREWIDRIKAMRAVGLNRDRNNWEVNELGSNYKMSELAAVLGVLHINNASQIIGERREIADYYNRNINFNERVSQFEIANSVESAYYKYIVRVKLPQYKEIIKTELLNIYNIHLPPNLYDHLCHDQKITKKTNTVNCDDSFINSEYMRDHHVCLPMYNGLSKKELSYITASLNKVIQGLA